MKIYIVRHGESVANEKKIVCGQSDYPLTNLGKNQILRSRDSLASIEFNQLYSSPLKRATETAQILFPTKIFSMEPMLMEMNTGDYSELSVEQLFENYPQYKYQGINPDLEYPNGESVSKLFSRISRWFQNKLNVWNQNENYLIVGHEATVVCAVHYFLKIPLYNYPSFKIENGNFVEITYLTKDNQCRVKFNN
jgi:broad specificity phosphatase PhoE